MKLAKTLAAATAMLMLMGLMVSSAFAVGVNITIPDTFVYGAEGTNYNQGISPKAGEDQETEGIPPNTAPGQVWDNEAFFLSGPRATATLQVLSGFNFQTGQQDPYREQKYLTGDIFIGTNPNWGTDRASNNAPLLGRTSDGNVPVSNSLYNYNYVIHLDASSGTSITATFYSIDSTANLQTNYFHDFDQVGPYKWLSVGTEVASSVTLTETTLGDADTLGYLGGTHYLLELPVGMWLPDGTYYFHYNYGCGNDLLMGEATFSGDHFTPTPVPSTVLLLGSGLTGLAFWRRRRASLKA